MDPAAFGLPGPARRRTPGLRREEVARRADVSVEWYTRLEQGRGGAPSAAVLNSVAHALELSSAEREHAFLLAHGRGPVRPSAPAAVIGPRLTRVLSGFVHGPAYIKNAAWDVLAWNAAASAVLTDYGALPPGERNVLKILFRDPSARSLLLDWDAEARLAVATFRLELARWGGTDEAQALVQEMRHGDADFARMWDAHAVSALGEGTKILRHPRAGDLSMSYSSFAVDDAPGLGLVLYTPQTDQDAQRVRRLLHRA